MLSVTNNEMFLFGLLLKIIGGKKNETQLHVTNYMALTSLKHFIQEKKWSIMEEEKGVEKGRKENRITRLVIKDTAIDTLNLAKNFLSCCNCLLNVFRRMCQACKSSFKL